MKTTLGRLVIFALGVLMIGLRVGHAQIMNQMDFEMSEPFTVADTTLPAGSYIIRPVSGTESTVIEIVGANGHPSVMVEAESAQPDPGQAGSHLVFNKYKNVLALSQVFPGSGNAGYQLATGRPEKLAAKAEKPTQQTVAPTSK